MEIFNYPFDGMYLLSKRKRIKRELLEIGGQRLKKNIAILGGSTTHDIKDMLELFCLNYGIEPAFYESEYAQYWQDAMFPNAELDTFQPDIIFIHTTLRNISVFPRMTDAPEYITDLLHTEYERFSAMWDNLRNRYRCTIIQNNFEYPYWRLMGNRDAGDIHGRVNFVTRLNLMFAQYAQSHEGFYINDINYLSADYGLEKWSDPFYWHMYKYALAVPAIPNLAFSVANIVKSIYGKNKKAFALDLDHTLWGGVVGDDGVEGLQIGQETPMGQAYSELQSYIKAHKQLGVILNVVSKNSLENALAGLNHPDSTLKPDDFIAIKANWEPKPQNLMDISQELSLLPESFVFVDDNPAEREIVRQQISGACVPELGDRPEHYIKVLDRSGFFEVTALTADDMKRGEMYKNEAVRKQQQTVFADYGKYLRSLAMKAVIKGFEPPYMGRIAQLTNKSNQFNLTTKRYTQDEIEAAAVNPNCITLYGKLEDKFGDNGVVAVAIGEIEGDTAHIILWLMSCRVLKRGMEFAMMDEFVCQCKSRGLREVKGYYYPTAKNGMVRDFYDIQGFTLQREDENGNRIYSLDLEGRTKDRNQYIEVER